LFLRQYTAQHMADRVKHIHFWQEALAVCRWLYRFCPSCKCSYTIDETRTSFSVVRYMFPSFLRNLVRKHSVVSFINQFASTFQKFEGVEAGTIVRLTKFDELNVSWCLRFFSGLKRKWYRESVFCSVSSSVYPSSSLESTDPGPTIIISMKVCSGQVRFNIPSWMCAYHQYRHPGCSFCCWCFCVVRNHACREFTYL